MTARTPVQGYQRASITNERENNINTGLSNNTNTHNRNAWRFQISQSPQDYNRSPIENIDKPLSRQNDSGRVGQRSSEREKGESFDTYKSVVERGSTHYHNEEAREEVDRTSARARDIDDKVDEFDQHSKALPQSEQTIESKMAFNGRAVEELEMRNKLHSAKIHELERELRNVKMDNQVIRERPGDNYGDNYGPGGGYNGDSGFQQGSPRNYGAKGGYPEHPGDAGDSRWRESNPADVGSTQYQAQPNVQRDGKGRRIYEYDQYKQFHRSGEHDGEIYWGLNKMYNPASVTSYRREQVPLQLRKEEREQEEEWRRQREMEKNRTLTDKQKTYDYSIRYQDFEAPRDMNKYFHDSKYFYEQGRRDIPDEEYFNQREPGGLMFIRFHDSGYDNVNLALRELQTIVKSYGGYVMGIGRKHNIIVLDGNQGWQTSSKSRPRPDINASHILTDNAVATFWFPNRDKAFLFLKTSHKNRFSDMNGFPNQYSYEAHFVPLVSAPSLRSQDTLLMMELPDAGKYPKEDLDKFEEEVEHVLKNVLPSSQKIAAALQGRESFKLGPMFTGRSKVFVSCVGSLEEVAHVWNKKIIQDAQYHNRIGPMNVSAVALRDWSEF